MSLEVNLIEEKIKNTLCDSFKKMTFRCGNDPKWHYFKDAVSISNCDDTRYIDLFCIKKETHHNDINTCAGLYCLGMVYYGYWSDLSDACFDDMKESEGVGDFMLYMRENGFDWNDLYEEMMTDEFNHIYYVDDSVNEKKLFILETDESFLFLNCLYSSVASNSSRANIVTSLNTSGFITTILLYFLP